MLRTQRNGPEFHFLLAFYPSYRTISRSGKTTNLYVVTRTGSPMLQNSVIIFPIDVFSGDGLQYSENSLKEMRLI